MLTSQVRPMPSRTGQPGITSLTLHVDAKHRPARFQRLFIARNAPTGHLEFRLCRRRSVTCTLVRIPSLSRRSTTTRHRLLKRLTIFIVLAPSTPTSHAHIFATLGKSPSPFFQPVATSSSPTKSPLANRKAARRERREVAERRLNKALADRSARQLSGLLAL